MGKSIRICKSDGVDWMTDEGYWQQSGWLSKPVFYPATAASLPQPRLKPAKGTDGSDESPDEKENVQTFNWCLSQAREAIGKEIDDSPKKAE